MVEFYQITSSQPLLVVDLSQSGSHGLKYSTHTLSLTLSSYGVYGTTTIRDAGKWKEVETPDTVFSMKKTSDYPYYKLEVCLRHE